MEIVFEDEQILMIDKPAGVVVNRAETIREETVQDQVEAYLEIRNPKLETRNKFKIINSNSQNSSEAEFSNRTGIVHRLDRETSGLLIVAKTQKAFENLQKQFLQRSVNKKYIALVHGKVTNKEGSIESRIGRIGKFGKFGVISVRGRSGVGGTGWGADGKPSSALQGRASEGKESRTEYILEKSYSFDGDKFQNFSAGLNKNRINYLKHHAIDYTLLSVFPKTGRTHQIRVHLKSIGHPVVSDLIYAPGKLLKFDLMWCPRLFLHAANLEFVHPKSGKSVSFKSDLPEELKNAILNLNKID